MNLLKPLTLAALAFGATLFFLSGYTQAEGRKFNIVVNTPTLVILYECNNNRRTAVTSNTLTDGVRTLHIIQGPCTEV